MLYHLNSCSVKYKHYAFVQSACHRSQPRPWQHVFSDRLQLSALTEVSTASGPIWEAPDLDRLVISCSRLQKLSLRCTRSLQLTALLQLSNLVQLWLEGETDSSTMASLAQLSALQGLHQLAVTCPWRFSGRLFNTLTALTQLTYLALPEYSENGPSIEQLLQRCDKPSWVFDQWPTASCSTITTTVSG